MKRWCLVAQKLNPACSQSEVTPLDPKYRYRVQCAKPTLSVLAPTLVIMSTSLH